MKKAQTISRRDFLKNVAISTCGATAFVFGANAHASNPIAVAKVKSGRLLLEIDGGLRQRIIAQKPNGNVVLSDFSNSDQLQFNNEKIADKFRFVKFESAKITTPYGSGTEYKIIGQSGENIEKTNIFQIIDGFEDCIIAKTKFRNLSNSDLKIKKYSINNHLIISNSKGFWSYSGATHQDRRDWVQPIKPDFNQNNFMGMNASDYGGGTPIIDVWRNDYGIAIGHLQDVPKLVALPMIATKSGVSIGINFEKEIDFPKGAQIETIENFVILHTGDHFAALNKYRQLMTKKGIAPAKCHDACYEPIWCAWGYDRVFTTQEVLETLPKVKELGLKWVVLDDGWQTSEGDWKLDKTKFPNGDASMVEFVQAIKARGLKPRLWLAPLAVDPGTDLMHEHVDMLLLNQWGEPQLISWWNSFYLCPAYSATIDYMKALVRKIIGEWGFEGLKIDGQHLNGVAPCYNKAHKHKYPEESFEKLADFWREIYETAISINPNAVVEICPCGTSYSYFNMPYMNQAPASDPLSSWQVRLKGKSLKALMGKGAPYAGDHVELSDGGNDFASTIGIGAIVSTKFTWPNEGRGPDNPNFKLTAEREALWKKWINLYNEMQLPKGEYLGDLYDIGFDKPEAHAIKKDGAIYYAFYAPKWRGKVEFRGLGAGSYRIFDYFNQKELGQVSRANPYLNASFEKFLLVKAIPLGA